MDKPLTLYAEVDDPELVAEFKETLAREARSMRAVVILAVKDYIARSKAEADRTTAKREKTRA